MSEASSDASYVGPLVSELSSVDGPELCDGEVSLPPGVGRRLVRVRGIANQAPRTLTLTERTHELNPTPNPNQVSLPPGPPSSRASQSLVEPSQSLTGFGVNTPAGTCSFGPGRLGLSSAGQGDGQVLPLAAGQLRIDPSYASAPGYFGRSTAEQDQMHQLQRGQPSLGPVAWH